VTIVYCEDNRCPYRGEAGGEGRGRCTAKILLMRSIAPPNECESCQWCVPLNEEEEKV